jgi:hypothetical protein
MSGLSFTNEVVAAQNLSDEYPEPQKGVTGGTNDTHNVAILLFQHVDILDFTGPLEIFTCATHLPQSSFAFNTSLIAAALTVKANSR